MSKLKEIKKNAAGIDLGSAEFYVSVDGVTVRSFETFTSSIIELIKYLKEHFIKTVAMESTGVLWIPLYDMLEKIKNDKHCLDNIELIMSNGTKRKISQTTVKNIRKYLLYRKDDPVIKIDL